MGDEQITAKFRRRRRPGNPGHDPLPDRRERGPQGLAGNRGGLRRKDHPADLPARRIRLSVSKHSTDDIVSKQRDAIEEEIKAELAKSFGSKGIIIEDVLLSQVAPAPRGPGAHAAPATSSNSRPVA
ncbi:MAG: SPFH domain-containing protein [Hymenobacter sp.]